MCVCVCVCVWLRLPVSHQACFVLAGCTRHSEYATSAVCVLAGWLYQAQ